MMEEMRSTFSFIYPRSSEVVMETSQSSRDLIAAASMTEMRKKEAKHKLDQAINERYKDSSPEAKLGRRNAMFRAAYGEFMCTCLFYTPIFATVANTYLNNWDPNLASLAVAFVGGFQAIGISFAFSSVSGAHFNSSISFALWLTGKLSNRKIIFYVLVQLLASIVAMCVVAAIFSGGPDGMQGIFDACAVVPADDRMLGKVFATEFFFTFILTYTAFTVAFEDAENQKKDSMSFKTIADTRGLTLYASTPQSKTGFAPFSIGLAIFSLSLMGGSSGGAFNPGRLFGPAIFSGKWDYLWLYWIAEVMGASCAGLLVNNLHRFGIQGAVVTSETGVASHAIEAAAAQATENSDKGAVADMFLNSAVNNPLQRSSSLVLKPQQGSHDPA